MTTPRETGPERNGSDGGSEWVPADLFAEVPTSSSAPPPEEAAASRIAVDLARRIGLPSTAQALPPPPGETDPGGPFPHLPTTDAAVRDALASLWSPPGEEVPGTFSPGAGENVPGTSGPGGAHDLPSHPVPFDAVPSYYFLPGAPPAEVATSAPQGGTAGDLDVEAVRKEFPALQQEVNGKPLVWLDNAATTQKPRCVIETLARHYAKDNSNIHRGAHTLAARATEAYESAREVVRRFLGAGAVEEIVFVRGTTEAINLVAGSWGRKSVGAGDEILLTRLEHHANIVPWQMLAHERGAVLKVVPITDRGEPILEEYQRLLGPRTRIAAFTHVSNALGTVLPVKEMTALAHRQGARVLVDGAQSVPHLRANVQEIGADFYVFSGHKVYGPTGIGVLYARRDVQEEMPPWQGGGNMIRTVTFERTTYADPPAKFEAGTPSIADAVGLGRAIEFLERLGIENVARYEHGLVEYGMQRLAEVPGLRLIGTAPDKASVMSFVLEGARTEDVGRYLDTEGIAVRAGHHCAQPTLRHYGLDGTVRPSVALYNTRAEIDRLVAALERFRPA